MFFPVSGRITAFALTLAIELPIVVWLLRRAEPDPRRRVALVVFANFATHPAVWYVFSQWFLVGTVEYLVAAEGWAVAAEAVFYVVAVRGLGAGRALVVAVLANGASFVVGRIIDTVRPELFRTRAIRYVPRSTAGTVDPIRPGG
jgi:hypothetical protein